MIELLVKYIQDKGYKVDVMPGYLIISKQVGGEICSISWGISKYDFQPHMEEWLYYQAHKKMDEIDKAIVDRFSCPIGGKQ